MSSKLVGINLNNYIYVSLDSKGEEIVNNAYGGDASAFKVSEMPGYYKLQFHQLIDLFGNTCRGCYAPFSMCAFIERKDIVELSGGI